MRRHTLPRALFSVLVTGAAAAQTAVALPPVKAEVVDEATMAGISGKYYGANMLVGLRIDVVSTLHNPGHGTAQANGSLVIQRNGNGFDVAVDTRASAESVAAGELPTGAATGGESLQINGIGQISQIAGDGNRMSNVTSISFSPDSLTTGDGGFNGSLSSTAGAGAMAAQITFLDGGMQLDLTGPGSILGQSFSPGANGVDGRILQVGQIAGNGITGSNQIHLQLMTSLMPSLWQQSLGTLQALAGLRGLSR